MAADNDVDGEGIELDAAAHPPDILGSDQVDPEPRKGSRTISPLVRSKASLSIAVGFTVGGSCRPRASGGIGPPIGALASTLANSNAIDVCGNTFFEKRQQLVLGWVKAIGAGARVGPDHEIKRS
jgi:hypothetical protein